MRTIRSLLLFAISAAALFAAGCSDSSSPAPETQEEPYVADSIHYAVIHTNYGDIEVEFYWELAPKTVRNFVELSHRGYYDGVIFHRVIKDFMMQGGDPTGTGNGGESIYGPTFEDEIDVFNPIVQRGYRRGTMAMANAGPNTNGSQFFIMHKDYTLPRKYTIFGNVVDGIATVDSICNTPTDSHDRPIDSVYMKNITLLRKQ